MNTHHLEILTVNAFSDSPNGCNPAGIVLNADQLSYEEKLLIAQKIGFSETAFVSTSGKADFKLDFFTPSRQIGDCGHATVATFKALLEKGLLKNERSSKEIQAGVREIIIKDGQIFMEQSAPVYTHPLDKEVGQYEILQSLHLTYEDIKGQAMVVKTEENYLVLEIKNEAKLKNIEPDFKAIENISDKLDLIGYYIFTRDTEGADASVRMFAPRYGINEESATGIGAGTLASYLYDYVKINKEHIVIKQGYLMPDPSPSLLYIYLELEDKKIKKLLVGGNAVITGKLSVEELFQLT